MGFWNGLANLFTSEFDHRDYRDAKRQEALNDIQEPFRNFASQLSSTLTEEFKPSSVRREEYAARQEARAEAAREAEFRQIEKDFKKLTKDIKGTARRTRDIAQAVGADELSEVVMQDADMLIDATPEEQAAYVAEQDQIAYQNATAQPFDKEAADKALANYESPNNYDLLFEEATETKLTAIKGDKLEEFQKEQKAGQQRA